MSDRAEDLVFAISRVIGHLLDGDYDDGEHPVVRKAIQDLREARDIFIRSRP